MNDEGCGWAPGPGARWRTLAGSCGTRSSPRAPPSSRHDASTLDGAVAAVASPLANGSREEEELGRKRRKRRIEYRAGFSVASQVVAVGSSSRGARK